ncbi:sensor domain-containing diguanylate cyclase [Sulfurimonas sp.]|nr:sensor domain-containing diguanylate cyclase [Sulfurimonas sp.]
MNEDDKKLQALGTIINNTKEEIYIFSADTYRFTYLNDTAINNIGYSCDEVTNLTPFDIKPEYSKENFTKLIQPLLDGKEDVISFETYHQRKDTSRYDVEIRLQKMTIGEEIQFVVFASDISSIKVSDIKLKVFAKAIEQMDDSVRMTDIHGIMTYVNRAIINRSGYSREELIGKNSSIFSSGKHDREFYKNLWDTIMSGNVFQTNIINKKKNGELYHESMTISPILNKRGDITNFISTSKDITEQVELESKLRKLATLDSLTGIYNRYKVNEAIEEEISRSNRYNSSFSLLMFDIDFFKKVNDNYGHDVGDNVLIELAKLVSTEIREGDKFGRWGGEEFMIVLPQIDEAGLLSFSEKLREKIYQHEFADISKMSVSIGITTFENEDVKEALIKRVDNALYAAKDKGRNCVVFN